MTYAHSGKAENEKKKREITCLNERTEEKKI
jgi:hypothetical protein